MQRIKRVIYRQDGGLNRQFLFVGLMVGYLMWSLLLWVMQHLQPVAG